MQEAVCQFFGGAFIEIKINKEVRDYQEAIFFGLSLRQCVCSVLAVVTAVLLYFSLQSRLGQSEVGWACILAALPFALCGFFRYNGMYFEQFIRAFVRSELLYPKRLKFKPKNLYVTVMEQSSMKEALRID